MEFTGKLFGLTKDWNTGELVVSFSVENPRFAENLERLKGKRLALEAKQYRDKRSLDSNAYCWALLQKMAEAIGCSKEECYLYCLKRYSRAFTHITIAEEAIPKMMECWRTVVDLGEVSRGFHQLQVYYGSHTFDTKEMSVFLDGIISECNELGIPTATPEQIERMNEVWKAHCSQKI